MNFLSLILSISILGSKIEWCENMTSNGFVALQRDFNYHASIFIRNIYECGGGIIDTTHVITAAHCVEKHKLDDILIIFGVEDLTSEARVFRSVAEIFVPADFYTNRRSNDIAVISLNEPLVFGDNIQPISLPSAPVSDNGTICWFTGLERTRVESNEWKLSWIPMRKISRTICECLGGYEPPPNVLCVLDISKTIKPTPGDSGGILICNEVAVGIFAARMETLVFTSNLFNSIYHHLRFIRKAISFSTY